MAVGNYQLVVGINCAGNYTAIVTHWQTPDDSGSSSFDYAKDLALTFMSEAGMNPFILDLLSLLSSDSFISSVVARRVGPVGGNSFAKSYAPTTVVGQLTTPLDASMVAGCFIFLTGADAGLNGRLFLPGVAEESLQNGRWVSDYKSYAFLVGTGWVAGLTGLLSTWKPVLKHGSPPSYTEIKHMYLSPDPGTQRRRRIPV